MQEYYAQKSFYIPTNIPLMLMRWKCFSVCLTDHTTLVVRPQGLWRNGINETMSIWLGTQFTQHCTNVVDRK